MNNFDSEKKITQNIKYSFIIKLIAEPVIATSPKQGRMQGPYV